MARPKRRPKTQTSKPKRRSLWPLTPRKETLERSGSLRLASPPASWDCASAAEALTNNSPTAAMALFRALQRCDQALLSQVCIDGLHLLLTSVSRQCVTASGRWGTMGFEGRTCSRTLVTGDFV